MNRVELGERLQQGAAALGWALEVPVRERLLDYLDLLLKWNRVYNLTALRDPGQVLTHHLLDSLAVLAPLRRHTGGAAARLLDVGSGAGLPGVVIAIACPELQVTCIDAVAKKTAFVQTVATALQLPHLQAAHGRVETLRDHHHEVVVSRAFASLAEFVTLSEGALAPGGAWLAMKGRRPDAEIAALPPAVEVFHVEQLMVPGLDAERCLVWMRRAAPEA